MKLYERDDYRNSFFDGMCANVFITLTNGVFLTGFALHLGMSEWMIGVMVAIPNMGTLFQLFGSYYICKKGGRKSIAARAATLARIMWLPILVVGLWCPHGNSGQIALVLTFFFVSHAFAAVSYVAWLAWTSDLVPDELRGSFFGTRNMLCGAAGIAAVLIFGNLVDVFKSHPNGAALAVGVPFFCAIVLGLISVRYLNRVSDSATPPLGGQNILREWVKPFREANYRNFLLFTLSWNFSVYLSAPFFALYFLRELNYTYGFVALLATIASVVDLLGMKFWGAVSDRIKNRAVIQVAGWGVVLLPSLWVLVRPHDLLLPVAIQIIGGGFWAGVNLCTNNMVLRISPQEGRVWFISAYSITAGVGAAVAPIIAGALLSMLPGRLPGPGTGEILSLHYIFIASTVLRVVSLLVFRRVHEPQEFSASHLFTLLGHIGRHAVSGRLRPLMESMSSVPNAAKMVRLSKRPAVRQPL
jgi:MFS family permease